MTDLTKEQIETVLKRWTTGDDDVPMWDLCSMALKYLDQKSKLDEVSLTLYYLHGFIEGIEHLNKSDVLKTIDKALALLNQSPVDGSGV